MTTTDRRQRALDKAVQQHLTWASNGNPAATITFADLQRAHRELGEGAWGRLSTHNAMQHFHNALDPAFEIVTNAYHQWEEARIEIDNRLPEPLTMTNPKNGATVQVTCAIIRDTLLEAGCKVVPA